MATRLCIALICVLSAFQYCIGTCRPNFKHFRTFVHHLDMSGTVVWPSLVTGLNLKDVKTIAGKCKTKKLR